MKGGAYIHVYGEGMNCNAASTLNFDRINWTHVDCNIPLLAGYLVSMDANGTSVLYVVASLVTFAVDPDNNQCSLKPPHKPYIYWGFLFSALLSSFYSFVLCKRLNLF